MGTFFLEHWRFFTSRTAITLVVHVGDPVQEISWVQKHHTFLCTMHAFFCFCFGSLGRFFALKLIVSSGG